VFSTNSAVWFSPNGNKIAFIEFNATNVHALPLPIYGLPGQYKYPQVRIVNTKIIFKENIIIYILPSQILEVRYPKSGAPNPTVKLYTVDLKEINQVNVNQKTELITPPTRLASVEHLITSVSWANDEKLISVWMNRVQNQGLIYKCTEGLSNCEDLMNLDTNEGWIEFFTPPFFNQIGSEMTFIHSNQGYRHVALLNIDNKNMIAKTSGNYVVTEILKFNKQQNVIIYTANTADDVKAQNIYAIHVASGNSVCLTCNLHNGHTYYNAEVSEDGKNLVILANGPEIPRADLYTLNVENSSNISLTNHVELEYNGELKGALAEKNMPKKIFDVIKLDEETEAYVMMLLPPNIDEDKKYPMLIEVYGGPDSTSVTNRFNIEWGTYVASSLGIVYAKIDGRGSGLRSDKHLHALYKNLGTVEVDDQVRTASKLTEKYKYLDEKRIAIWGKYLF
jgi:dipeptidyl-peptidase 4